VNFKRDIPPGRSYAPNLAPMVDVVMVILVFFMLGARLAVEEGALPTELPSQVGPGGGANVTIIPTIHIALIETADGHGCRIFMMDLQLPDGSFSSLRAALQQKRDDGANPDGRVLIESSPNVEYQHVISAMDACVGAGFSNIQFPAGGAG